MTKHSKHPLFAPISYRILKEPPIRHGSSDGAKLLTAFELAIGISLTAQAARTLADARHEQAMASGLQYMDSRRNEPRIDNAARAVYGGKVPKSCFVPRTRAVRKAGSKGYKAEKDALRRQRIPPTITLRTTRNAILGAVGLPKGGKSFALVDAALDRLTQPAGKFSAPVIRVKDDGTTLKIVLRTRWMKLALSPRPAAIANAKSINSIRLVSMDLDVEPQRHQSRAAGSEHG